MAARPCRSTSKPVSLRKLEPRHCKFDAGVFYRDRSNIGLTIVGPAYISNFGKARFVRENLRREFPRLKSMRIIQGFGLANGRDGPVSINPSTVRFLAVPSA